MKPINLLQALGAFVNRRGDALLPVILLFAALISGQAYADVPLRTLPGGSVPNPGTQQQELANITAPAEWNVFEFVVTCGACHAGTQDQHVGHFGNWAGGNMASAARDPIFRAAQISANNTVKAVTGDDGAGNVCMRCHSPNGWLSGRFDPTMGGKADASNMIQSILLSTDSEGISCETCHRAVGSVTNKRQDLDPNDNTWDLLLGLFDWEHAGDAPVDQVGTQTIAEGGPLGDTTLQFLDGMTYIGKYSGMTDVYFSDLPITGTPYTGQIYAVYPDTWVADGNPTNPVPAGQPAFNTAGQKLAYNLDGTLPPLFELPISTPTSPSGSPVFASQAFSIEHPTVGGNGRGGKFPFVNNGVARNDLLPDLPAGAGGSASPNEFIRTSEFCGSCHDLTVPVLNHGMPEQRTYSEWKFSDYAKSTHAITDPLGKRSGNGAERCQDCHMPTLKHEYTDLDSGSYNADPFLVGGFPYGKNRAAQGGTAIHKLTGSNRDLPEMMKALYPEVDLEVIGAPTGKDPRVFPGMLSDRGPMWDRAKQNTEITLRDGVGVQISQAPTETIPPSESIPGSNNFDIPGSGIYELKVKVINKSGHRIPSGYPDGRRFWLSVQAKDATGTPVYTSGVYDAANAELKTTSTEAFKRSLSNLIDATVPANNAVQVYERVTGTCTDSAGAAIFPDPTAGLPSACTPSPSVLNNFILFDNRIPPKGFDAVNARLAGVKFWNYGASNVPVEDAARYTSAQLEGGYDEVTYRFTAPTGSLLTASAEVQWQTHSREFMEHLRTADTSTVRPEGPPNPLDPNYPNVPNYLSNAINGSPLSSYKALDNSPLNDNWGGVAYASWLATGKGAPFVVARDDSAVSAAPDASTLTVSELQPSDPGYIDPVTLAPNVFAAKFSWTPVANADGYTIWIRYGKDTTGATADWDRLVTVGKDVTSHIENVLGDASVNSPGKTYGFKVVAFNGKGDTPSAVVDHVVATALPAAPTGLTASRTAPGSTGNQITLNWNDNANNEAGFEIWRYGPISVGGVPKVYNGLPPLTVIGPAAGGGIGTATGGPAVVGQAITGANSYIDSDATLLTDACYNYQVRAVSANVDVSTWTVAPSAGCTLAAPATVNLSALPTSGTRVELTWTSNAATATSFAVKRDGVTIGTVAKTAATSYAFADTLAVPGTTYAYTVEATGTNPLVVGSATVTTPAVPSVPTGANAMVNGVQVTLSWIDTSNNEDGFVVERAPVVNGVVGAFQQVPGVGAFLAPNTSTFLDTSPLEAQTAVYRVKAINLVTGDSGYASSNQVTLGLFAPANLVATINAGLPTPTNINVTVNWLDVSQKETSYLVERKIGVNGAWTTIAPALPANSQQLANAFPVNPTAFNVQFRVTAVFGVLTSQPVLTTVAVPARPVTGPIPTVNGATATSLNVNFTLPAGSVGYQLQRRVGNNGWTNLGATLGTGAVTVIDTGLTSGTSYQYQLKVANPGGWSANWSASGTGTTLFPPPVAVNNTATGTANAAATQNISVGNVLTNDLPAGAAGRTVTGLSAVIHTTGGGANPATASVSCTAAGNCTVALTSPGTNNTGALRQTSKRGTYTFTYIVSYGGQTSAPATVTLTVN